MTRLLRTLAALLLLPALALAQPLRLNPALLGGNTGPTLDLNFMTGTLPAAVSFSRTSPAWCFDANGNLAQFASGAPRFCYDPATHQMLGLLVEQGTTNQVPNSTMQGAVAQATLLTNGYFTTPGGAGWTVTTAGTGTANFNTPGSVAISGDNANSVYVSQGFPTTPGTSYAITGTNSSTASINMSAFTSPTTGTLATVTMGQGAYTLTFTATGTTSYVSFWRTSTGAATVSAVNVQPALVSNGTFSGTSGAGWTVDLAGSTGSVRFATTGQMTITGDGSANIIKVYQMVPTVAGHTYTATFTQATNPVNFISGGTAESAGILNVAPAAPGTYSYQFTAVGSSTSIGFARASTGGTTISNVSVTDAGQFPTNSAEVTNNLGLLGTIIGTGSENGIPYIDVAGTGTTFSAAASFNYTPFPLPTSKQVVAASGQTWTKSAFVRLLGGAFPSFAQLIIDEADANGAFLVNGGSSFTSATTAPLASQRFSYTRTLSNAATAYVYSSVYFQAPTAGTTVSFVARIGQPDLTQTSVPTSPIPTYGSPVTRAADTVTVTLPPVFGPLSVAAQWMHPYAMPGGYTPDLFGVGYGGSSQNGLDLQITAIGAAQNISMLGNSVAASVSTANNLVAGVVNKVAATTGRAPMLDVLNGGAVASVAGTPYAGPFNWMQLGNYRAGALNGYIQRVRLWPRALTPSELQGVTR